MIQNRFLLTSNIVTRLRLVFAAIALILLAATVNGFIQVRTLTAAVNELTVSSVSVFVRTEETERRLKNLLLLLRKVETVTDLEELVPLESQVQAELSRLRDDTEDLNETDTSEMVAGFMLNAFDEIEQTASDALTTKRSLLTGAVRLSELGEQAVASHENLHALMEEMSYEAAESAYAEFQANGETENIDLRQVEDLYHYNLILANNITEISLGLEAVFDGAMRLTVSSEGVPLDEAERVLRFQLRNIALLVGQLPASENRLALAQKVVDLRDLLFDDGGIVGQASDLFASAAAFRDRTSEQIAPIEFISSRSDQLTQAARDRIDAARIELSETTDRITLTFSLATLLTLLTIGASLFFIVEAQINKRMARLIKAVLAIAGGDTEYHVDVTGDDELGKVATALEVFRLNAEELYRSNIELEKFAYVAAHDLRSPLRAIQDLLEWTVEDEDNVFSEDGRENMELLQARVDRLNKLLSDLLEYSRVGKEANDLSDVSIAEMVADIAELLDPHDNFHVRLQSEHDVVLTYATPLRQCLLNLVSNAIKHHDRSIGRITVKMRLSADRLYFHIYDDGPGIPPKYHEKIFGLFQTLRPRDEVEGSGLGLAMIRKLLERYNSVISVRSNPETERGSVFSFTLPEKSSDLIEIDRAA